MDLSKVPASILGRINILPDGCWAWNGEHRKKDGRPIFNKRYVYRILFKILIGPLSDEAVLPHRQCEHKWRANPWHTVPITQGEHMREHGFGGDSNVGQAEKKHCPAGHPYEGDNLRISKTKDGTERVCRECRRLSRKKRYYSNIEIERQKARDYQRRKRSGVN